MTARLPGLYDRGEPYAEVRRSGRWSWWITVHHGPTSSLEGHIVVGSRQRADRIAARFLARYRREQDRWNDVHRIPAVPAPVPVSRPMSVEYPPTNFED